MKITFLVIGKTKSDALIALESEYLKRLQGYCKIEYKVLPSSSKSTKMSVDEIKKEEKDLIFANISNTEYIFTLDENGADFSSQGFSEWLKNSMLYNRNSMTVLIGGAYGIHDEIKKRSDILVSLSKMTFSHQMVRTIFLEQLYRAFSILNNKPYHH